MDETAVVTVNLRPDKPVPSHFNNQAPGMQGAVLPNSSAGDGMESAPRRPGESRWVTPLWVVLGIATVVAVGSVISIAVPNLTGTDTKQLELMWKIAATIGASAGGVLGWIVKHQSAEQLQFQKYESDIKLAKFQATLNERQKERDDAVASENKNIETIVAGHVQLAVQGKLNEQRITNEKELERHRQELDFEFKRRTLQLEDEFADARARKEASEPALEALSSAIARVQSAFRALTTTGSGVSKEDLDRRIDAALAAKTELEISRRAVKSAIKILPEGFGKLARKLDIVLLGIIKQVREVPNVDELDPDDLATLNREFERIGRPAMMKYGARLRTLSAYLIISIEYQLDPNLFVEQRVRHEKNRSARTLVTFLRRQSPSLQIPSGRFPFNSNRR